MKRWMTSLDRAYCAAAASVLLMLAAFLCVGCGSGRAEDSSTAVSSGSDGASTALDTENSAGTEADSYFVNLAAGVTPVHSVDEAAHTQIMVLDLGQVRTVGYCRIVWEDLTVQSYTLEGSTDGENYTKLYTADQAPYLAEDWIELPEAAKVRYVRFSVVGSVTFPVPELYEENPWDAVEDAIRVSYESFSDSKAAQLDGQGDGSETETGEADEKDAAETSVSKADETAGGQAAGSDVDTVDRQLASGRIVTSGMPKGITATYGGCDLEQVVYCADENGSLDKVYAYPALQEKTVHVGFHLAYGNWRVDSKDYEVTVPAGAAENTEVSAADVELADTEAEDAETEDAGARNTEAEVSEDSGVSSQNEGENPCPDVIPALQEWKGGAGSTVLWDGVVILVNDKIVSAGDYGEKEQTQEENAKEVNSEEDSLTDTSEQTAAQDVADLLAEDLADETGWNVSVGREAEPTNEELVSPNAILLELNADNPANAGLGEEGYRMRLEDSQVVISAADRKGLYWGTRTLLQMVRLAETDHSDNDDAGTEENESAENKNNSASIENKTPQSNTTQSESQNTFAGKEKKKTAGSESSAASSVSLPSGWIRDYPTSPVRGVILDVGRNTVSLHALEQIAAQLSWYKMNELTLHLNDNALMTYSDKTDTVEDAMTAYAAYRMESAIKGTNGLSVTASDLSYSKADFQALVSKLEERGIRVVPELDMPAHSLAFTRAFPSLALTGRPTSVEMLDCSKTESLELAEQLWQEQLDTSFQECGTISIGGDEYYSSADDYISFMNGLIGQLGTNRTLRMWGSLSRLQGTNRVAASAGSGAIEMNLWSTQWADPAIMYRAGYQVINTRSDLLYINCGEASDYLDTEKIYDCWQLNTYEVAAKDANGNETGEVKTESLPRWSSQLRGASIAVWNDLIDNLEIGICEYDMIDRVLAALPTVSDRFWGSEQGNVSGRTYEELCAAAEKLGYAPGSDPLDQDNEELAGPDYDITMEIVWNGGTENNGAVPFLVERDGETYDFSLYQTNAGSVTAAASNTAQDNTADDQSETSSDTTEHTAEQGSTNGAGQIGFSREFYSYLFDAEMPVKTWTTLRVVGTKDQTTLYVNGQKVGTLGSAEANTEHATFVFPLTRNKDFDGEIRHFELTR